MNFFRRGERPGGRKFAEWTTLILSVLVVVGLASYLALLSFREPTRTLLPQWHLLVEQSEKRGDFFIVPLVISNPEKRAISSFKFAVLEVGGPRPPKVWQEIEVEYLGGTESQTIFLFFDRDPAAMQIEIKPLYYRLK